ncbi:MAG: DNA/RNA nuclease SfsA [Rhodobacteraceae bacterium]|nr:DNA/RNA nuclease SfsA [Paracoccaceae bacterium]
MSYKYKTARSVSQLYLPKNEKKLNYGWRLVEHENGHFTGVDTSVPNRALRASLESGEIAELAAYHTIRPEVNYGKASRIDFLLTQPGLPDCYVEVKSATLCHQPGLAEFPDSVTKRGTKHLGELTHMVQLGHRAVMLYLVQRTDCQRFQLAADIDPTYAAAFAQARSAGVERLVYATHISPDEITLGPALPAS